LTSDDLAPLPCTSINIHSPPLVVSACECEDIQKICGSLDDLRETTVDTLPFCFLPSASVDAIIFTEHSIITIQITNAQSHDAEGIVFSNIIENLPVLPTSTIQGEKSKGNVEPPILCHVFLTDREEKARALRHQTLTELPRNIHVYSAVFDVGRFKVNSEHMRRLDKARVRGSWQ